MIRQCAGLALATSGLLSCKLATDGSARTVAGVVEFRSAHAQQRIPAPFLVAMDSLHLDVTSGDGAEQRAEGRALAPTDTIVTITTRVLEGPLSVSARVLNARRDTLFAGAASSTVTADDFRLSVLLTPLRPVLAVSPARLDLQRTSDDVPSTTTITIYNRGDSVLVWRLRFVGCSSLQCGLFTTPRGIPRDSSQVAVVYHYFQASAAGSLIVNSVRDSLVIPFQVP